MENVPLPLKLKVNILLRAKQYIPARDLITSPECLSYLEETGMDLITEICDRGLNETEDFSEILIIADMLTYIAKHLSPRLALISFLEQAEVFNFSSKFSIFVQPLGIIVSRMPNKKLGNFAWVLKTLHSHLKTFESIPQKVRKYKNQDQSAVQNDPVIQQMLCYYNELCAFYETLVLELLAIAAGPVPDPSSSSAATKETNMAIANTNSLKALLRDNLIDLLGPPLVHLSIGWTSVVDQEIQGSKKDSPEKNQQLPKSEARLIAEKIMHVLEKVNFDPNYFISWVERKQKAAQIPEMMEAEDADEEKNEDSFEPHVLSVSCFMYLLYGEKWSPALLPSVTYSPSYIFEIQMYLINEFLSASLDNESFLLKGLGLARGLVDLVNSASPFTIETFDQEGQSEFLERLGTLTVFCESRPVRVAAVDVFTKYFWAYDATGKRKVLTHLFNTVKDPGLFGHCITQLKECIRIALNDKENNATSTVTGQGQNTMQGNFLQSNLFKILQPLCALDNGVQTDLIGTSNKIIPLLNLLRYVFIRDGAKNLTGVKKIMNNIESDFLKPLRLDLDLSKAHFQRRLEEVKNSDGPTASKPQLGAGDGEMEVALSVGDEDVEEVQPIQDTKENQIACMNSALGTLDLLESLWARVNETFTLFTSNS